jgi:hypothetical protein
MSYYAFEMRNMVNPTIRVETYTFSGGPKHYMHPMGFAYYPDGRDDKPNWNLPLLQLRRDRHVANATARRHVLLGR